MFIYLFINKIYGDVVPKLVVRKHWIIVWDFLFYCKDGQISLNWLFYIIMIKFIIVDLKLR